MSSVSDKKSRPAYWRSFAELENSPEFQEFVQREFPAPLELDPPNSPGRRRFMQVMGASFALAGAAGCRWDEEKLLPFAQRPEGVVPGEPRQYATSMELGGVAVGLRVQSYDGRPVKIEGNPLHPSSLGSANIYHQASILGLYDPDRSHGVVRRGGGQRTPATWSDFETFAREHFGALRAKGGTGLGILAESSSSPSLAATKRRLLAALPNARWHEFEPLSDDNARGGSLLAFGRPYRTVLELERAAVVVTLDADPIANEHPAGLVNARKLIRGRVPDDGTMNRVYAIESRYTLTGGVADHRLPVRAELIKAIAAALDGSVGQALGGAADFGPAQPRPNAAILQDPEVSKFLAVVTKDLLEHRGRSVIVAGEHQPPEVHALVHRLNAVLGNVGNTLHYIEEIDPERQGHVAELRQLLTEIDAGQIETLVILGGNPVFTAPADLPFGSALAKVKTSIHLSLYEDETSRLSSWHLPRAHYLESWGDAQAHDGTVSLIQPLIAPLLQGRSDLELLSLLAGQRTDGLRIVRSTHSGLDDRAWKKALHDGLIANTAAERLSPRVRPIPPLQFNPRELGGKQLENGQYEIVFAADANMHDGRFANNAWLQELPQTYSKLTWGNAALMSPGTAAEIGAVDGTVVSVAVGGRELILPAVLAPGQADGSIRIAVGHGRTAAGRVGGSQDQNVESVGANAYQIRSTEMYYIGQGVRVTAHGKTLHLPTTQDVHSIDQMGHDGVQARLPMIVREGTLTQYKAKPDFAQHVVHHPPLLNLWVPPVSYEGHKWGMAIDMNKCIGCSACVTACQAENNIPVVGPKNVAMGREMLWLRVDRYYQGSPSNPRVSFQPMPCQHCENAPCEQVCPVGATMHSSEGLNDMVYNRCIGTRYCSNNCPYKVRRFNYFNYNIDVIGETPYTPTKDPDAKLRSMVFNPEVTVRSRGVMEKCTYCVQRIQSVKIRAKNERRPIEDGEIQTACQQTCPTEAIVFGDLNDNKAQVAKQQNLPRAYAVLEELNNRPRTQYLARIRNPHPELV